MNTTVQNLYATSKNLSLETYRELLEYSRRDTDQFWTDVASLISWKHPFHTLRESRNGADAWFLGGVINYVDLVFANKPKDQEALTILETDGSIKRYSYLQLHERVSKLVELLQRQGLRAGEGVHICTNDRELQVLLSLATTCCGAIFSHSFFRVPNQSLLQQVHTTQPKIVIHDNTLRNEDTPDYSSVVSIREVINAEFLRTFVAPRPSA